MSPNGNHPLFPKHPDGSRDLDTEWDPNETWKLMEKLLKTGKTKAIGVSNYSVPFLEKLLQHASVPPAVNQIENHPYLPQQEILDFCKQKGILVESYSPLGSTGSPLFKEEAVVELAKKYGVGPGTILISYQCALSLQSSRIDYIMLTSFTVSKGNVVLPKSVTPSRIEENRKTIDLESSDVAALDAIHKTKGLTRFVSL